MRKKGESWAAQALPFIVARSKYVTQLHIILLFSIKKYKNNKKYNKN